MHRSPRRALVLGSGGAAGIAWQAGILAGLAESGVSVADADLIVGTSAGAVVAAHLALGLAPEEIVRTAAVPREAVGRLTPGVVVRLALAQVWPSRRHALLWLGRWSAARARRPRALGEDAWVAQFAAGLAGMPWPDRLVVVAVGADTGRPAYFTSRARVDLARAVAASCAVPGVFPPVTIEGHPYLDGGLRSPANIDVAQDCDVIVALAPLTGSSQVHRRPEHQGSAMAPRTRVVLLTPDAASLRAFGVDPLDSARNRLAADAGRALGRARAAEVRAEWGAGPSDQRT